MQADPVIPVDPTQDSQALNRYSYTFNNPLKFTDPSGNEPEETDETRPPAVTPKAGEDGKKPAPTQNGDSSGKGNATNGSSGINGLGTPDGRNSGSGGPSGNVPWWNGAVEKIGDAAGYLQSGIHTGLDIAGTFDPTPISDTINAAGYAGEALAGQGGWGNAAISAAAVIPYAGDAGKVFKYGKTGIKAAEKATDAAKGMNNPAVREAAAKGRQIHQKFAEKVRQKLGWKSEKTISGTKLRPDAIDPKGRPIELKPNTTSGRATGARQIERYKDATGTNGRIIYYNQ